MFHSLYSLSCSLNAVCGLIVWLQCLLSIVVPATKPMQSVSTWHFITWSSYSQLFPTFYYLSLFIAVLYLCDVILILSFSSLDMVFFHFFEHIYNVWLRYLSTKSNIKAWGSFCWLLLSINGSKFKISLMPYHYFC